jgi:hypothetical protein
MDTHENAANALVQLQNVSIHGRPAKVNPYHYSTRATHLTYGSFFFFTCTSSLGVRIVPQLDGNLMVVSNNNINKTGTMATATMAKYMVEEVNQTTRDVVKGYLLSARCI